MVAPAVVVHSFLVIQFISFGRLRQRSEVYALLPIMLLVSIVT